MKRILLIVSLAALASSGCARFSTKQTDTRNETETKVTTRASAFTLFSSKSELTNWEAEQTEGTQGAKVGGLTQETQEPNAVEVLKAIAELINSAGIK